ncbi:MAG: cytochrome c [Anaerolineae bacterium]
MSPSARRFTPNTAPAVTGLGGKGDGELVQTGEVPRPLDFTDPATSGSQRPDTWFNTITNGNVEHLMPPWRDELTDAERREVALYTYTLPDTREQIEHGRELFAAHCVECHGKAAQAPRARDQISTQPADLTDLGEMATLSRDTLLQIVTEGSGDDMPSFADKLSEAERRDVIAYARTFALANADAIGTTVQATAEAPASTRRSAPRR